MKSRFGFSPEECKILSKLGTPQKIQDYLDKIDYNLEEHEETFYSPRKILREKKANCIEGAVFAAAALRFHGHPPLIADLTSVRDDDHIIAVFKKNGHWGSIGKSKYPILTYREPIHKNMRELALTFFEEYFNFYRQKTMRGFSNPVDLSRFDKLNWMTTEKNLFFIERYLYKVKHKKLITKPMIRSLRRTTQDVKDAGELWIVKHSMSHKIRPKHH